MSKFFTRLFSKKLVLLTIIVAGTVFKAQAQAPAISYTSATVAYTQGTAITPATPANSGGGVGRSYNFGTLDGSSGLNNPQGVVSDAQGNVYVADQNNNVIRKITAAGVMTIFAGSGSSGNADGAADVASFNSPAGLVFDSQGNLYVADNSNGSIRKITAAGVVSTLATGIPNPYGLVADAQDNLYVSSFSYDSSIRKVTSAGVVTVFAGSGNGGFANGTGTAATFNNPADITIDAQGNIYVADMYNQLIRKITPAAVVTTFAGVYNQSGFNDGTGTSAQFYYPMGITVDPYGNLFVAEPYSYRVRRVTQGAVVTTPTYLNTNAGFITSDKVGNLLFPDGNGNVIRKTTITGFNISPALPDGLTFDENSGTIDGTPTQFSAATNYSVTASDGTNISTSIINITVNQVAPVIAAISPAAVYAPAPGEVKITGTYFGRSLADVTSLTYGPTGTEFSGSNIIFDSPTQIRFTPGVLTQGTNYKVVLTVLTKVSAASTSVFRGAVPPVISYNPNTFTFIEGAAITPITSTNSGDAITRSYTVSTIAGNPNVGGNADGLGSAATFDFPVGVTTDAQGNIYVIDHNTANIRKVTPSGLVTTLAGSGSQGYAEGQGTAAYFNHPVGMTSDVAGNIYVADRDNSVVRKVTPAGLVSTFAGTPQQGGFTDGVGAAARFNGLFAIAIDAAGNLYVADKNNNAIRKITPAGVVSTLAGGTGGYADGTGSAARFNSPSGVATDAQGNVYVADTNNQLIRKITPAGVVTTLAGTPGQGGSANGTGSAATFAAPINLTTDIHGNLYVLDKEHRLIRKVTSAGVVTTVAGNGNGGDDDGDGATATFGDFYGIAIDNKGNLFIGDNNSLRKIQITGYGIDPSLPTGLSLDENTGTISGTPIVSSPATDYHITASNGFITSAASTVNITVTQVPPVITAITPVLVDGAMTNEITLTGNYLGSSLADITGITYGANGTGSAGTNIKFDSPTQVRFTTAALAQGTNYKVIISVLGAASAPSTATFRAAAAPTISYTPNIVVYTQGTAITPATPAVAGDVMGRSYTVSTFAGLANVDGNQDGQGSAARFSFPIGIVSDPLGNFYVTDWSANVIRKVTSDGTTTLFAGGGSGDAQGAAAGFQNPQGITLDAQGNVYVSDVSVQKIRKITPGGLVSTFAGNGNFGSTDGPGLSATFGTPWDLAIDAQGNLYVADKDNNKIRKITPAGIVSTLAGSGNAGYTNGTGAAADFNQPNGVAVDAQGNVFVADRNNQVIRKITPAGDVTTFAGTAGQSGTADGTGTAAQFSGPTKLAFDAQGNLYVTDKDSRLIRKITQTGVVTTIAGTANVGGHADGPGSSASFGDYYGITVDNKGNVFVADGSDNKTIRKITITGYGINPALPLGLTFDDNTGIISGTPTVFAPAVNYAVTQSNGFNIGSTTLNLTVNQVPPVITSITPASVYSAAPGVITLTGNYFGRNAADITSITYGANGTGTLGTNIIFDSPTQVRFTASALTPGVDNKVIITVAATPSAVSTAMFHAIAPPVLSITPNTVTLTQGNAITPITPANTGDLLTKTSTVSTLAGLAGQQGNIDGQGSAARFNSPTGVATDLQGNTYVSDINARVIRKITADGTVTTLAGNPQANGNSDGQGTAASFTYPAGLTTDASGNIYVADTYNQTIRKITPTGLVSTFAGTISTTGSADGVGTAATFNYPNDVTADAQGNIYVADVSNQLIRKITPAGVVSTLAGSANNAGNADGTGTAAMFNSPYGVVADAQGNVYVSDQGNHSIRKITSAGVVTTLAGHPGNAGYDDGTGAGAYFYYPTKLTINGDGNLFVSEQYTNRIRKVTPAGVVTTVAGALFNGGSNDGDVSQATFSGPNGIATDAIGNLLIADANNYTIRKIKFTGFSVSPTLLPGLTFNENTGTISGTPVLVSAAKTYTVTANDSYSKGSATITLSVSAPPPPVITYANGTQVYPIAVAIAPLTPTNTGSAITGLNTVGTIATGFNSPSGVVRDGQGNLYATDNNNNQIKQIAADGTVTIIAGSGQQGSADGIGTAATFYNPQGIALDALGNIYVSDAGNGTIRKIAPGGVVTTVAGNNSPGFANGIGTAAQFNNPVGLTVDALGNIFVADVNNQVIRQITPAGVVTTFAGIQGQAGNADGTGIAASFNTPYGLTIDTQGNLFVADYNNNSIRKITPAGVVTTVSSSAGPVTLNTPSGVAVDNAGNLYVSSRNSSQINRVSTTGYVTLIAGGGGGYGDGNNTNAYFNGPRALVLDGSTLYITDQNNGALRRLFLNNYSISSALPTGLVFDNATGIISGTPQAASPATNYTIIATNLGGVSTATVNITVTVPAAPVIAYTPNSQTYITGTIIATYAPANTGGAALPGSGTVSTFAGTGSQGSGNGTGIAASFNRPAGIAKDAAGNLYVADSRNNEIRKITPAGVVTTFAGSTTSGRANGTGTAATFNRLNGIAIDPLGNLYVADQSNNQIRKITSAGVVTTFAGAIGGGTGSANGIGTAATFNSPAAIATDNQGNVYVVDANNRLIRKIATDGTVTTLAGSAGTAGSADGTGTAATFNGPSGIATDALGNVYVADSNNQLIRKITQAGVVTTFAGSVNNAGNADGTGTSATFNAPYGIAVDSIGNVYVSESNNNLMRKITPAGVVTTLAGIAQATGNTNGIGSIATFSNPRGLVVDGNGNLFIADYNNSLIRKVVVNGYNIDKTLPVGLVFNQDNGAITGTPTVAMATKTYTVTATNYGGSGVTNINITAIPPAPTVQATNVVFTSTAATTTTASWTVGDGTARVVFIKATNTANPLPVDGTTYTANTVYGSGTQIGTTGWYAVYNGSGTSVAITGLTAGTTYRAMVVEYKGAAGGEKFLTTTGTGNPANVTTISNDATLSALALSNGTLTPVFALATLSYTASVANTVTSITVTPTTNVTLSTVTVNGTAVSSATASQAISLVVGTNTITSVVTAQDGTTKKTYTVVVTRAPSAIATLSNIALSSGTLTPVFAAATTGYTASVANTVTSLTLTPTVTDATATVTVNGTAVSSATASQAISLVVGANTITTIVTAQDGTTKQTYTVVVTRAPSAIATLSNITLSSGTLTPAFAAGTASYTASVANTVTSLTLTPTTTASTATVTVNGTAVSSATASQAISLVVGTNTITTVVTAQDGTTKQTYTVVVTRAPSAVATLSNIALSSGTLTPAFATGTASYAASVANTVTSLTLTPTTTASTATITVNGTAVSSATASQAISLVVGANTIITVVTAQDGTTKQTYTVVVTRAPSAIATLSNIALSSGTLTPTFAAGTTSYSASVSNATTSVTLTPTVTDATATITVNGSAINSGSASAAIPLVVGANTITTVVTAQDGTTKITYSVTVNRAPSANANLVNLAVSSGTLSPVFSNGTSSYTVSVGTFIDRLTVTPTLSDVTASVTINGSTSNNVSLNYGNNVITVIITAQDGTTRNTYTINVYRAVAPDTVSASNIMTPNGDGKNDTWVVKDILLYPDNNVAIYDRAGRVVYSKHGYDNTFDGTLRSAPLTEGTYYYTIDLGVGFKPIKGFITILRTR
jgi:gliding motility-associated-like protein